MEIVGIVVNFSHYGIYLRSTFYVELLTLIGRSKYKKVFFFNIFLLELTAENIYIYSTSLLDEFLCDF